MAKKKNANVLEHIAYEGDKNILQENIGEACTSYMQIFGANNNLMRQIPSLTDGLKPGARRILYTMYNDMPQGRHIKVAKILGEVVGTYHPHGDASVFETLVAMAQNFNYLLTMVDGQGNYGSISGQSAAAPRYIEAKLSKYAYKCFFEEFDKNTIMMKPTFDNNSVEPEYLPARYPNVLIANTFGIGYGTATDIPSYNPKEVFELTIKLIDDPYHADVTLIPDSPTGADIIDHGEFRKISETGRGKYTMRGRIDIDYDNNILIIKSIPIRTNTDQIIEKIALLSKANVLRGIKDIQDRGSKEVGMWIEIHLKEEIDPVAMCHNIYTKTGMETGVSINFHLVDDYISNSYNIKTLLLQWIDFRRETKRSYYNHKLISATERKHILDILIHILSGKNGEKTMNVIRKANSDEIVNFLMKEFGMSSLQAKQISEMRLSAFSKDSVERYKKELEKVNDNVKKYNKIVRSGKAIDKIIKEELEEGIKLFGQERRSRVINIAGEVKIRNTEHIEVFTLNGKVKKLPKEVTSIGTIAQGDYPIEIMHVNNITDLLIFDQTGKISKIPVHQLPNSTMDSEGENLSKYAKVNGRITSIIPKPTEESLAKVKVPIYFVMATKNGIVKKTEASKYTNIKNELLAMIVKDDDELQSVKLLAGDKDLLVYTSDGFGVRFSSDLIKETGRMSIGLKAIDINPGEQLIGMDIVNSKDKYIFILTNKGTGKKCTLNNFKTMDRASKPLRITSLNDGEHIILIRTIKGTEKFKAFLKNSVETIDIEEDVVELPRLSKGKKILGVKKGEVIIDIKEDK